jgi:hypothetical protein
VKVKYNVKGVDSRGGPRVKPGAYIVSVKEIEVGESKAKDPMMTITFQVIKNADGTKSEFKGQTVRQWILLDHSDEGAREAGQSRLRQFLEAIGQVQGTKGEQGTLDTNKAEGTELQLQISSDKDQDGEYMPRVKKMWGLDAEESESEEDGGEDESEEPEEDEEPEEEEPEEEDAVDLDELDRSELKKLIKEEGLGSLKDLGINKGTSDDDIRKIIAEKMGAEESEEEPEEESEDEAPDYSEWDAKQLKAELQERGLELDGKFAKSKAVKALKEDDGSDSDPF